MTKSEREKMVIKVIIESGKPYKILNSVKGIAQHIRIEGFGDVYPTTGTWLDGNNKWHRKDLDGFIAALLADKSKSREQESRGSLAQRIANLEDRLARVEVFLEANSLSLN